MSKKLATAQWCAPCKQLKQWMESSGITDVEFVDIEKTPIEGVRGIPTLIVDGEFFVGLAPIKAELLKG